MGWASRIGESGQRGLVELADELDQADPHGSIAERSRVLCIGLGELAAATYHALGGRRWKNEVLLAAAKLALLTKLDDEVIDSLAFHGGYKTDRAAVAKRVEGFLSPTLEATQTGRTSHVLPRARFAAGLGTDLQRLASPASSKHPTAPLVRLLKRIESGWATQVESVVQFTALPMVENGAASDSDDPRIINVSRRISGDWLSMIALVGTLPEDVTDEFTAQNDRSFYDWGFEIQRADALSDFLKDQAEGLINTWAGLCASRVDEAAYRRAVMGRDSQSAIRLLHRSPARERMPAAAALAHAQAGALENLGEMNQLLRGIYEYLLSRYDESDRLDVRDRKEDRQPTAPTIHGSERPTAGC